MNLSRIILLLTVALLFAFLHSFFLKTFFYWEYDWLDVGMHIWGGALVIVTWYEVISRFKKTTDSVLGPLTVLLVAIIVWEFFKYLIGGTVADNYPTDTATDTLAGLFGGLIAFYLYRSRTIKAS